MVNTIEKTIRPFFLVCFIFGFGILRHPLDRPRLHLSICYMLIVWSIYGCAFYYINVFFMSYIVINFVKLFATTVNWFTTMISIITTVRKYKKFWKCIKKLGLVDHTLEQLGIFKEYHKMRNSIKWSLTIWLTMICMTWTITIYYFWYKQLFNDIRAIIFPFIINYSLYVNTWIDIMFAFILRCIGTRLDKINECIEQIANTNAYGLRCTWQKSSVTNHYIRNTNNYKRVLWTAMHLHSELCRIAHNINCLFGVQITLQMSVYCVALTEILYFQYHAVFCILQKYISTTIILKLILCNNIWFIIFLTKLISLNCICQSVSTKAQKTKNIIHKLSNFTYFAEVHEEICQFVLQLSLRPLRISGMGLFYFGYNFIRKLFVWILASVVIMVQMDKCSLASNNEILLK